MVVNLLKEDISLNANSIKIQIRFFNKKNILLTYLIFNLVAKHSIVYIISNNFIYFILFLRKKKTN